MSFNFPDMAVIIRHSGECTYNRLLHYFQNRLPLACIGTVTGPSFESVLTSSYEAAIDFKKKWTIIIDADIVLSSILGRFMHQAISEIEENYLGFSFLLWDRFYNAPKYRGLHVYRTEYLIHAKEFIPEEGKELRPETYVKDKMKKQGYYWRKLGNVVGLHDYFQSPADVFAKMAIRAHRSTDDLQKLRMFFEKEKHSHVDMEVALAGLLFGSGLCRNHVSNSRITYTEGYREQFGAQNFNTEEFKWKQYKIDWFLNKILLRKSIKFFVANNYKLITDKNSL